MEYYPWVTYASQENFYQGSAKYQGLPEIKGNNDQIAAMTKV